MTIGVTFIINPVYSPYPYDLGSDSYPINFKFVVYEI